MDPEVAKLLGPYLTVLVSLVLGVMGYGALRAKVEGWDAIRKEDNDAHETASLRQANELKDQKAECDRDLARQRAEIDRAIDLVRQDVGKHDQDLNGIGGRLNAMNREIGETRSDLSRAIASEQHRIDQHAMRSEKQQEKNAEFYAAEAKRVLERVEEVLRTQEARGPSA